MNRRNFLRGVIIAGASFNILPGAGRIWKAQRPDLVVNPAWVEAPYEVSFLTLPESNLDYSKLYKELPITFRIR